MAKTNFTKAEEALAGALHKMTVEQLWHEAGGRKDPTAEEKFKTEQARIHLLKEMDRELKKLHKADTEVYKKIGMSRKELEGLAQDPAKITAEQWEKVAAAKTKINEQLKLLPANPVTDEKLVEDERLKHINKRFNVNDKWLPLK